MLAARFKSKVANNRGLIPPNADRFRVLTLDLSNLTVIYMQIFN